MYVFFFKQKTAYEMRISDWSSDVCSSDLLRPLRRAGMASMAPDATATATMKMLFLSTKNCRRSTEVPERKCGGLQRVCSPPGKLGRASCMERVCQYV